MACNYLGKTVKWICPRTQYSQKVEIVQIGGTCLYLGKLKYSQKVKIFRNDRKGLPLPEKDCKMFKNPILQKSSDSSNREGMFLPGKAEIGSSRI